MSFMLMYVLFTLYVLAAGVFTILGLHPIAGWCIVLAITNILGMLWKSMECY